MAVAFFAGRVRAVWAIPWRQDRVLEMVVNELVPVVVCVPFLVLIRMLQGKPFAAVGFDVPNEMTKMTADGCWCRRWGVRG